MLTDLYRQLSPTTSIHWRPESLDPSRAETTVVFVSPQELSLFHHSTALPSLREIIDRRPSSGEIDTLKSEINTAHDIAKARFQEAGENFYFTHQEAIQLHALVGVMECVSDPFTLDQGIIRINQALNVILETKPEITVEKIQDHLRKRWKTFFEENPKLPKLLSVLSQELFDICSGGYEMSSQGYPDIRAIESLISRRVILWTSEDWSICPRASKEQNKPLPWLLLKDKERPVIQQILPSIISAKDLLKPQP
ncbi:MAG: hypothetical protein IPJ69_04760 [Deltaproteobacteria bacterium]|nr:MAG: hypothetical protein IPJ69_04760 [Deltaproteobacteria bacterium]